MPYEIERKFLTTSDRWRASAHAVRYCQGYLSRDPERTVRVRIAGEHAFLTVKGLTTHHSRPEFEYAIPLEDARQMLTLCAGPLIEKHRFEVTHDGRTWEIDEYLGDNAGLIVAEIELERADDEPTLPEWIGAEVSSDPRYFNSNLASMPYREWPKPWLPIPCPTG